MPIDTAQERKAASGLPFLPLGPGVTNDATQAAPWRREAGWGYTLTPTPPPVGVAGDDRIVLGVKESLGTPVSPTIGGGWHL